MNIKLADGLPFHPTLRHPRTGNRLRAVFQRKNGEYVWPVIGASDEDTSNDDTDADQDGDEDQDSDDEDKSTKDSEPDKDKDKSKDTKKPPQTEADKLKNRLRAADRRREAAEQELRNLKDKDLPAAEKLKKDHDEAVKSRDEFRGKYESLAVEYAFLKASLGSNINWYDIEDAIAAARIKDVELDDDGSVEGMLDIVKELAKKKPHLVRKSKKDDEDDDDDQDAKKTARGASGSGVGSGAGRKKGTNGTPSREELLRKYPALNQ